jgi:predicted RecA/RadA family phage recombinase
MAKNYKGTADRIDIFSAGSTFTSGTPRVEGGWAGVPVTSGSTGDRYTMIVDGEFALTAPAGSPAQGDLVYITAADGTLKFSSTTGDRPLGKITRIAGNEGVPTGIMWVRISPFTYAVTA